MIAVTCTDRAISIRTCSGISGTSAAGLFPEVPAREPALSLERAAGLLPGIDAALKMAHRFKAAILRGLHRHRRALAEGAIEQDALAGRAGKLVEHAAGPHIDLDVRIGGMDRARNDAVLLAL